MVPTSACLQGQEHSDDFVRLHCQLANLCSITRKAPSQQTQAASQKCDSWLQSIDFDSTLDLDTGVEAGVRAG